MFFYPMLETVTKVTLAVFFSLSGLGLVLIAIDPLVAADLKSGIAPILYSPAPFLLGLPVLVLFILAVIESFFMG